MAQSPFDLMTQFGTSIEDTKKLIAGLKPYKEQAVADFEAQKQIQAKIAEIRTKPVTVMSAFQAKALGFNIPDLGPDSDQWKIKFLADAKDPQGFKVSFISPTGWEQTQDGLFISPVSEGSKTYTREQLNQLIQENKDQQAQFEKTRSIFGKVFPGGDMAAIKAFADTDDKGFQQWIFQAGDNDDTRFIMKKVYQITDEQLDAFFHPAQVTPPESVVSPSDEGAALTPAPSVPIIIPAEGFTMKVLRDGKVVDAWINQDYQVWVGNENNPTYQYNHETGEFEALTGDTTGLTPEQRVQKFDVSRGREALQTPVAPAKAKPMQLAIQNNQIGTIDPATGAFTPIDASKLQGGPVTPQPQVTPPQGPGLTMDFQGLPLEPTTLGAPATAKVGKETRFTMTENQVLDVMNQIANQPNPPTNLFWNPEGAEEAYRDKWGRAPEGMMAVLAPFFNSPVGQMLSPAIGAEGSGGFLEALLMNPVIAPFASGGVGKLAFTEAGLRRTGKAIGQAGREMATGIPSALETSGKMGLKPITFQASEGAGAIGKGPLTKAHGPDPNINYDFKYRVVSLDDLVTSHDQQLRPNPNYSIKELQGRLRDRVTSKTQINDISNRLVPDELLRDTGTISEGAPIIGSDMMVESGNGRVIALKQTRDTLPKNWQHYENRLKQIAPEYGIKPEDIQGIKNPVLVRERVTPLDKAGRVKFADEANAPVGLEFSPVENAIRDKRIITDEALAGIQTNETINIDGALNLAGNRPFVNQFIQNISPNERAKLLTSEGLLNSDGLTRIKSAIFAKVFPGKSGENLLSIFAESTAPEIKTIENAIFDSLPQLSKAESLVATGARSADLSIADDMAKAMDMLRRLKRDNINPQDYIKQIGMFNRELTPFQEKLVGVLDYYGRNRKNIREIIQEYANKVIAEPPANQATFLTGMKLTKEEIFEPVLANAKSKEFAGPLFQTIEGQERQVSGRTVEAISPELAQPKTQVTPIEAKVKPPEAVPAKAVPEVKVGEGLMPEKVWTIGGKDTGSTIPLFTKSDVLKMNVEQKTKLASTLGWIDEQGNLTELGKIMLTEEPGNLSPNIRELVNEIKKVSKVKLLEAPIGKLPEVKPPVQEVKPPVKAAGQGAVPPVEPPKGPEGRTNIPPSGQGSLPPGEPPISPPGITPAQPTPANAIEELRKALKEGKGLQRPTRALQHEERKIRVAKAIQDLKNQGLSAEEAFRKAKSEYAGKMPRPELTPPNISPEAQNVLRETVRTTPKIPETFVYTRTTADDALQKVFRGELPTNGEIQLLGELFGPELEGLLRGMRSLKEKIIENILDALNLPRAVKSAFDLSAPLRQGLWLFPRHIKRAIPAMGDMIKAAASEKFGQKIDDMFRGNIEKGIAPDPSWIKSQEHGLFYAPYGKGASSLTGREELFMSRIAEKIPGVRISERAYITYLNKFRQDVWKYYSEQLAKKGAEGWEYDTLADFINIATGRGELGRMGSISPQLSTIFFSPRMQAATIELPFMMASKSSAVRRMAIENILTTVASGAGLISLAAMGGSKVELDPRSSDFGKIRVGDTRIDIWGGKQQYITLLARLISGSAKSSVTGITYEIGPKSFAGDRIGTLVHFTRGKLAPGPGFLTDMSVGENFLGKPMTAKRLWGIVGDVIAPMSPQQTIESTKSQGALGAALSIPGYFGAGVNTYASQGADLVDKWKDDFTEYNSIPADLLEAEAQGLPNRAEYRRENPEIDAKLFLSGQVNSILTDRAGLFVKDLIKENNIDSQLVRGFKIATEEAQKRSELGVKSKQLTPTQRLIQGLPPKEPGPVKVTLAPELKKAVDDYSKLQARYGRNSPQAQLALIDDPELFAYIQSTEKIDPVVLSRDFLEKAVKFTQDERAYNAMETENRKDYLERHPEYARFRLEKVARGLFLPDEQIENYVDWRLAENTYEKQILLKENPDFYQVGLEKNLFKEIDLSKVPSREVQARWEQYSKLPDNDSIRMKFRLDNPELDKWLISAKGMNPIPEKKVEKLENPPSSEYLTLLKAYEKLPLGKAREDFRRSNPDFDKELQLHRSVAPLAPEKPTKPEKPKPPEKYAEYLKLPTWGNTRQKFRLANPDVEKYLVEELGLKPVTPLKPEPPPKPEKPKREAVKLPVIKTPKPPKVPKTPVVKTTTVKKKTVSSRVRRRLAYEGSSSKLRSG